MATTIINWTALTDEIEQQFVGLPTPPSWFVPVGPGVFWERTVSVPAAPPADPAAPAPAPVTLSQRRKIRL